MLLDAALIALILLAFSFLLARHLPTKELPPPPPLLYLPE